MSAPKMTGFVPRPKAGIAKFLGDDTDTPETTATAAAAPAPAVQPPAPVPAPAPSAATPPTPSTMPWHDPVVRLRADVLKQIPLRIREPLAKKLDWLVERNLIRSKMSFMTEVVEREVDALIMRELIRLGLSEAEARQAIGDGA